MVRVLSTQSMQTVVGTNSRRVGGLLDGLKTWNGGVCQCTGATSLTYDATLCPLRLQRTFLATNQVQVYLGGNLVLFYSKQILDASQSLSSTLWHEVEGALWPLHPDLTGSSLRWAILFSLSLLRDLAQLLSDLKQEAVTGYITSHPWNPLWATRHPNV